jgi:hypothetical protein
VPGRVEEGSGSSKSANERFGGIGRGGLDSVEETPGISKQRRTVAVYVSILEGSRGSGNTRGVDG